MILSLVFYTAEVILFLLFAIGCTAVGAALYFSMQDHTEWKRSNGRYWYNSNPPKSPKK